MMSPSPGMTRLQKSAMKSQRGGHKMKFISITALALFAAAPALAQQGVSPTEIVIGTAQDLSGPIVNFSKAAVNGMRMRIDEANAADRVTGAKLWLMAWAHGYGPKNAVLATEHIGSQN